LALAVGVVTAWFGFDLFRVAVCCCSVVFIAELFLI
ncbi:MAG: AzlD domain-containing protein, partial [Clostridiales bacterium]|nr:AzlD domain-containing protein [Clostridiales bacterium]